MRGFVDTLEKLERFNIERPCYLAKLDDVEPAIRDFSAPRGVGILACRDGIPAGIPRIGNSTLCLQAVPHPQECGRGSLKGHATYQPSPSLPHSVPCPYSTGLYRSIRASISLISSSRGPTRGGRTGPAGLPRISMAAFITETS